MAPVHTPQNRPEIQQIVPMFLQWYFRERPRETIALYKEYAAAFSNLFSFTFLLRTLFAPWKSIRDSYPSKGFNVEAIMQTFFLNITARAIGFVMRVFAMITGVIVQIVLAVSFIVYLLVWILYPALVPLVIILLLFGY